MRSAKRISEALHWLAGILLGVMAAVVLVQVFGRAANATIVGVDELSGYLAIWVCYLAVPFLLRQERHIRVDLLTRALSPSWQSALRLIGDVVVVIFGLLLLWQGIKLVQTSILLERVTPLLQMPTWMLQVVLPAGMVLLALEGVLDFSVTLQSVRSKKAPASMDMAPPAVLPSRGAEEEIKP